MSSPPRRMFLRYGISALALLLAGCGSAGENQTPTESSPTPTATPDPDNIEPTAEVIDQPSMDSPARIELGLTNTASEPISVTSIDGAYPLEWLEAASDTNGRLVFYPPDTPGIGLANLELSEAPQDGCWRLIETGDDGYLTVIGLQQTADIAPGETYTVEHELYYQDPEASCFSANEYQTSAGIKFVEATARRGPALRMTYTLSRDDDGQFTIDVTHEQFSLDSG